MMETTTLTSRYEALHRNRSDADHRWILLQQGGAGMSLQSGWRWCSKCQGLHFGGASPGTCPAGGAHTVEGSGNYALSNNDPQAPGQAGWRWCRKCQGLHFTGNTLGRCSAGATHTVEGSGEYRLFENNPSAPGQPDWRWCSKCQGLHFAGGHSGGVCPAGGAHVIEGSGNYALLEANIDHFRFSLDSFDILNTRSRHVDTVFVSASLAVGGRPAISATRAMGDLNNGHYGAGLTFDGVQVGDEEAAVFTYAIINTGHSDPGAVKTGLEQALSFLASKGAQAAASAAGGAVGAAVGASIGTAIVPVIGTALGALAGWLVSSATGLVFANCDGPVAAGLHVFKGGDLRMGIAATGAVRATDDHPGTDSPHGCGSNSHYRAAWSVSAV